MQVADAGGVFVVSPDTNPAVIARTLKRGMKSYPGVFSPSDAFRAFAGRRDGAQILPGGGARPQGHSRP